MNLQPKTVETNESASASTSAAEETQNREQKIRKTDGDSNPAHAEKMELTAQSTNACKDESKQTLSEVATSSGILRENSGQSKQEERMEIGSPEPPADDDSDIGEIHIVSVAAE